MKVLPVILASSLAAATGAALADHPRFNDLHLHDDVNRDYKADIFFQQGSALAYSTAGTAASGIYAGDGGPGYRVVAISDFDGDRSADVLWSNGSHLKLWINDGRGSYTPVSVGNYGGGWEPFAAGDINGDGRSDLFFRGATHIAYWLMDGPRVIRSSYAGDGGAGYRVVAIADFTGLYAAFNKTRRSADVLWTNGSQLKLWVGNPTTATFEPRMIGAYGGGWEPFAGGDLTDDGVADIVFRGGSHIAYWHLRAADASGISYGSQYAGDAGAGFRVVAISRYEIRDDYQGSQDILWSNGSRLKLWRNQCWGGCVGFAPIDLGSYGGGWQPLEMLIPQE